MTVIWILYVHLIQVRETDNMKKTPLIKKHGSMVMAMMQATPQTRKKLVKDSPSEVIRCVSECCHKRQCTFIISSEEEVVSKPSTSQTFSSKINICQKEKANFKSKRGISFVACTCIITIARKSSYWWNRRSS